MVLGGQGLSMLPGPSTLLVVQWGHVFIPTAAAIGEENANARFSVAARASKKCADRYPVSESSDLRKLKYFVLIYCICFVSD